MLRPLHSVLLRLAPELSHEIVVRLLRLYQAFRGRLLPPPHFPSAIRIPSFPRLDFPTRIGLAAGFDKNAEIFPALSFLGFGFIEVGTVTPLPQTGNPKPRLFRVPGGLVNQMGFNNIGVDRFVDNLVAMRSWVPRTPILVNIGKNKDTPLELAERDYEILFRKLEPWADGFVVNISSPNTPGLRDLQSEVFLDKVAQVATKEVPVLIKLSPDLERDPLHSVLSFVARSDRFSGVVLGNTSKAIARDRYHFDAGGYSGVELFERALERIAIARDILPSEKTIIGVGGVDSVERARTMRDAGADLIEIYTGFIYRGPKFIRELSESFSR